MKQEKKLHHSLDIKISHFMDDSVKILLLKIIKFNGDLSPFLKLGYEYSQIVKMINEEISEGNVRRETGLLTITEKGNDLIKDFSKKNKRKSSAIWIEPEIESRIDKIPIDSLYLPNQNELTFKFFE